MFIKKAKINGAVSERERSKRYAFSFVLSLTSWYVFARSSWWTGSSSGPRDKSGTHTTDDRRQTQKTGRPLSLFAYLPLAHKRSRW